MRHLREEMCFTESFGEILNYQVAPEVSLEKAYNHRLQANIRFEPITIYALP